MHFKVSKNVFLKELNFLQGAVEKKNTIPILSTILIEANENGLVIKGTDLDVSITTRCEAEVIAGGAVCLQARKLFDIVKALPEAEVEIKAGEKDQVTLLCERSRFKLLGQARENYPLIPEFKSVMGTVPAELLRDFISRTAFASTTEESRYALNGAKLEVNGTHIRMVATDGHRLSFIEKKGSFTEDGSIDAIIPRKTLAELQKLSSESNSPVEFSKDDNHLFFRLDKRILVSRMLSGQFPNYEMVLPKDIQRSFLVESQRLAGAVRRVALMADERSHAVKMEVTPEVLNITSQASDIGEAGETLPIQCPGETLSLAFNSQYLNDFFTVVPTGDLIFEFKDGNSQSQLRAHDEGAAYDFRYVIMPMRI